MDSFIEIRMGERNSVKIKQSQKRSIITNVFELITSKMVFNSSLTSSILGRLYKNLIEVTYLYVSTQIYVRTRKKVKIKVNFEIMKHFQITFRINNEPIIQLCYDGKVGLT
jgi:hypothetical protein